MHKSNSNYKIDKAYKPNSNYKVDKALKPNSNHKIDEMYELDSDYKADKASSNKVNSLNSSVFLLLLSQKS